MGAGHDRRILPETRQGSPSRSLRLKTAKRQQQYTTPTFFQVLVGCHEQAGCEKVYILPGVYETDPFSDTFAPRSSTPR